jgi:hypothetical protein
MNTDKTQVTEEESINFKDNKNKLNLACILVRDRYKLSEEDIEAVEFIFWISYYLERLTEDSIFAGQGGVEGWMGIQNIIDKLHFGDKISVLSDLYFEKGKKDDFIKFVRKINDLRNAVAHGRFSELTYRGNRLSDSKGQWKLINDFINFGKNLSPKTG